MDTIPYYVLKRRILSLIDNGYEHETVNHSKEFVTEDDVHTNRILSMWRPIRAYFRTRQIPTEAFADHVVEYHRRRSVRLARASTFESLRAFIQAKFPMRPVRSY